MQTRSVRCVFSFYLSLSLSISLYLSLSFSLSRSISFSRTHTPFAITRRGGDLCGNIRSNEMIILKREQILLLSSSSSSFVCTSINLTLEKKNRRNGRDAVVFVGRAGRRSAVVIRFYNFPPVASQGVSY